MKIEYINGQRMKVSTLDDLKTDWDITNTKVIPKSKRSKLARAIWGL